VINPTALILTAVMMLRHLGEFEAAASIEHAILVTLESGVRTGDIVGYDRGASTTAYTDAIIGNLGKRSERWQVREYKRQVLPQVDARPDFVRPASRRAVGLDLFVEAPLSPEELGRSIDELVQGSAFTLKMISSRGTQVYPSTGAITDTVDAYYCRLMLREPAEDVPPEDLADLLARVSTRHRWGHIEKLQEFDGEPGFSKAQGEN
jgi:isocitrate dehydrogenase